MRAGGVAADLAWWRAHRDLADRDTAAMGKALERLQAWKAQHDQERSRQLGFLQMAWDAVFGDEDEQVADAIRGLEADLAKQQNTSAKTGGAAGPARP